MSLRDVKSWYEFHNDLDLPTEKDLENIVHYDPDLGRVYLKKFKLHGQGMLYYIFFWFAIITAFSNKRVVFFLDFEVGDFFQDSIDGTDEVSYYRIVGAFQALKSFVGKWDRPTSDIQKRGNS